MCVQCRAVTRLILKQNINDIDGHAVGDETQVKKRKLQPLEVEHRSNSDGVKPQLGESGFFCMELFCGTGNLTYAMKHFFLTASELITK